MSYCNQCKIDIKDNKDNCPLCQSKLIKGKKEYDLVFPNIKTIYSKYKFVFKMLLFISIIASIICIFINIFIPTNPFWSFFVVGGIICTWVSLINAINNRKNITKTIIYQVIIICIFALIYDYSTNWHGWSIDYVIPLVFVNAIISMPITAKVLAYPIEDYILYLMIDCLFGIIPIIFLIFNMVSIKYPSIICVIGSSITIVTLLIFEGKNMLEQLKRKMHI